MLSLLGHVYKKILHRVDEPLNLLFCLGELMHAKCHSWGTKVSCRSHRSNRQHLPQVRNLKKAQITQDPTFLQFIQTGAALEILVHVRIVFWNTFSIHLFIRGFRLECWNRLFTWWKLRGHLKPVFTKWYSTVYQKAVSLPSLLPSPC